MIFKSPEAVCQPTNVIPPVWQVQCCVMIFWAEQSTELLSDSQNLLSESSRKLKKRRDYTLRTLPKYCFCFQFTWTDWEIHERARDDRGTAGRGQSATYWTNKHTSLFAHDWQKKKTTIYLWQLGVSLCKTLIMHQSGEGVYVYVCIYGSRCFLYGYNVSPDLNISVLSQLKPTNSHLCNLIYCFIFLLPSSIFFLSLMVCIADILFFKCQTEKSNTQWLNQPYAGWAWFQHVIQSLNGQEWNHCIHTDTN